MSERNRLSNGRFLHDLDEWTVSGATYSAGDGDSHFGVAVLSTGGDYVEQSFSVDHLRTYALHYAVKPVGAALGAGQATFAITDGNGDTVLSQDLNGATPNQWEETTVEIGLAPGTTYTLRLTNASAAGDVKLDDVWLWFVPITRAELAAEIARKLGALAADKGLTTTPAGDQTEGDYTDAVSKALREIGAVNPDTGEPDTRWLDASDVRAALDMVEAEVKERLFNEYLTDVDIKLGPRSENFSQVAKNIRSTGGGGKAGSGSGHVTTHRLGRGDLT